MARSPWPWWTILRSNRHTSREAQASFLLSSWSTPYQLEHTCIPHSVIYSVFTNIHRISSQILEYSTSIIWKYSLYLICPGTEAAGTFWWSHENMFYSGSFIDWTGCELSPFLKVEEKWNSLQGTKNEEISTFKMKVSSYVLMSWCSESCMNLCFLMRETQLDPRHQAFKC